MPDGLGIATAGRRIAEGLRTREAEKRQRTTEEQKRRETEEKERLKFEGEKKAFRFRHEGTPVVDYIDDFYETVGDEHRLHPSKDDLKAWDIRSQQEGEEDAAAIDEISQIYQSLTAEEEPEGFALPPELLSEFGLFPQGETKTRLDEQALSMQDLAQLSHITGQVAGGREFFGGLATRELLRGGVGELEAQRATRAGELAGREAAAKELTVRRLAPEEPEEPKPTPEEKGVAKAQTEVAYRAELEKIGKFVEKAPSVARLNRADKQAASAVALRFGDVYNPLPKNVRAIVGVGAVTDVSSMQAALKNIFKIGQRKFWNIDELLEDLGTPEQIRAMTDLGRELNVIFAGGESVLTETETLIEQTKKEIDDIKRGR